MIRFNKKTVIVLLVISALIVGVVLHAHHRNAEKNSAFLFDQIPKEEINYDSIQ